MEAAVAFAAAVAVLGPLSQKVVEFIRSTVPGINGNWTRLVALIVGTLLAYAFNVDPSGLCVPTAEGSCVGMREFPNVINWLIGGGGIAAWAGYLADRAGRSNATVVVSPALTTVMVHNPVIDPDV